METTELFALLLALMAGLSTLLGLVVLFFAQQKSEKLVTASLAFAAGVMVSVSFTDLLPQAQDSLSMATGEKWGILLSVVFLICGVVLASALDRLVPHEEYDVEKGEREHQNLFRVGFVSMLAIGLHNFPEGIATFMAGYENPELGIPIAIAIALHNIPEGISVAMPIYFATGDKKQALKYTFISGISEPIGALLAFLVLRPFISEFTLGFAFALVCGIMLYIVFEELIPSSRQYGQNHLALIATFTGICFMPLTHLF